MPLAEGKRKPGRPPGSTNRASAQKLGTTGEYSISGAMDEILETPEYLGQFFNRMFRPENHKRLSEWMQQQRAAINGLETLFSGRGQGGEQARHAGV
jgi:hypothetical protein